MGGGLKALNKGINIRGKLGNKSINGGLFDDRYLQEILKRYERNLCGDAMQRKRGDIDPYAPLVSIQININQSIYLHVLSGDGKQ